MIIMKIGHKEHKEEHKRLKSENILTKRFRSIYQATRIQRMSFCAFSVFFVLFMALLTESVERATGSYINSSIGDRGCRVAFVVEFVDSEHLPVTRGLQN